MNQASSGIREKRGTAVWHTMFMAIAGASILWLGWQFRALHVESQRIRSHDFRLVELAGEIIHLDEVLTMSARMAVATLDPAWENRYHWFEPQLDHAIKESLRLEPGTVGKFIAETDLANRELMAMEERSFGFVRRKDQHAAAAILLSPEYERQKKLYSDGMQRLAAAIDVRADAAMAAQQERVRLVFVILVVVLAVLFLSWIALSREGKRRLRAERRVSQVAGQALDESEIRTAEVTADLSNSRGLLQDVIDRSPLLICATNLEGRFVLANSGLESLLGTSPCELIGKLHHSILPAEVADQHRLNDLEVVQTGRAVAFEEEYWESDRKRVYHTVKFPLIDSAGKTYAIGGISTDITDRKRAEEALQEARDRLVEAQRVARVGNWEWDTVSDSITGSEEFYRLFDVPPEGITEFVQFSERLHPGDRERVQRDVTEALQQDRPYDTDYRVKCSDGAWRDINARGRVFHDADGKPVRMVGTCLEITERKQAEAALKESEERYAALFRGAAEGIAVADLETMMFIFANPAICRMLGYSEEEMKHLGVQDIHPAESLEHVLGEFEAQARGEKFLAPELPCRRKDGSVIYADVTASRMVLNNKHCNVGFFSDVTERRRAEEKMAQLEEQFQQAEKMESIGRLASGVAHDFNNLLAVIMGQCELLAARLGSDDPVSAPILEIDAAAQRAASLTRQLLAFSRRQAWEPKVIDLNTCVSNMDKMLRRLIGEDIELTLLLGSSLGCVRADPSQIEQVIMNLVVNARDAMPEGGTIAIRTEDVEIPDGAGNTRAGVPSGRYVLLAVNDSGSGIDESIRSHIFEPFFTTKEPGKGTGLGLSTVYGIVKKSEGYIDVESTIGAGTTFTVLLPRVSAVEESTKDELGGTPAQIGRGTILIVEDDPGVREIVRTALEMLGHAVLTAENGGHALALVQDREEAIDLLITDVAMPGLSGPELARSLAALRPGIPLIYMSGYADDAIIRDSISEPGHTFLHKPFRLDSLKHAVQAALSDVTLFRETQ